MSSFYGPLAAAAAAVLISSCGAASPSKIRDTAALDAVTSAIDVPATAASADARNHFLAGQRELDLTRGFEALDHFQRAVAADSTLAIAYLGLANTSNSLEDFKTNLARCSARSSCRSRSRARASTTTSAASSRWRSSSSRSIPRVRGRT